MESQTAPKENNLLYLSNSLARSAHTMPVLLKRLIYLAISKVRPADPGMMDVTMPVSDVAQVFGMDLSGDLYIQLKAYAEQSIKYVLDIKYPNGSWEIFNWVSYAKYDKDTDTITLRINEHLRPFVVNLQQQYTIHALRDMGKLQGRHALHWYEIIMSRQGQADSHGHWWVEYTIAELRHLFGLGANEYTQTAQLRIKVIDSPIAEINAADLGLDLRVEYIRRKRYLHAVRVHCQRVGRDDPRPVHPPTPEEQADEALIKAHQDRYDHHLAEVKAQPDLSGLTWASPQMRELDQQAEALERLKAELKAEQKAKRGRPRKASSLPVL